MLIDLSINANLHFQLFVTTPLLSVLSERCFAAKRYNPFLYGLYYTKILENPEA